MAANYPGGYPAGPRPGFTRASGFAGARGTGAIVSQVLISFVTQYHNEATQQLAADIKKLQAAAVQARQVEQAQLQRVIQLERVLSEAQSLRAKIANRVPETYKDLVKLQKQAAAEEADLGAVTAKTVAERAAVLAKIQATVPLDQHELYILQAQNATIIEMGAAQAAYVNATRNRAALEEQITANLTAQEVLREFANRQLATLSRVAVAAIGATVGAALFYQPLQDAITAVTSALKDMFDPAQAAKDALKDVADEISSIASDQNITNLQAAVELLKSLKIPGAENLAGRLAGAPDLQARQDQVDQLTKITSFLIGQAQLEKQITDQLRFQGIQVRLIAEGHADSAGALKSALDIVNLLPGGLTKALDLAEGLAPVLGLLNPELGAAAAHAREIFEAVGPIPGTMDAITQSTKDAADAYNELAQAAREAAINAAFDTQVAAVEATRDANIAAAEAYADNVIAGITAKAEAAAGAIEDNASARIDRLQRRITAVGNRGPSAQTNELAAAIERLNKAEQDRQFNASLADIAEQKYLILLRERLAATDKEINLDDYQGKARLVAIDALLARMQEQNAAQDRFNKLLDIQYQISQGVRRQQGETIQDFITRRAQYYRGLLQQAADLQRQGPEAELKAERARVQDSIELKDLEAKRRQLIDDRERKAHLDSLQKQLKASQDADNKAKQHEQQVLRDRIDTIRQHASDAIKEVNRQRDADIAATQRMRDEYIADQKARTQAQLDQLKQQREDMLHWTNNAEAGRYAIAVGGAKSIAELNAISGALAGANFSVAYVKSQLQALGFRPGDPTYETTIKNFQLMLDKYQSAFRNLTTGPRYLPGFGGGPGLGGQAEGGILPLTNMDIRRDIRVGERGPEGGIQTSQGLFVLNNQIMSQLRQMEANRASFDGATFNVQGSGDPYADRYYLKRMIKEAIKETVH